MNKPDPVDTIRDHSLARQRLQQSLLFGTSWREAPTKNVIIALMIGLIVTALIVGGLIAFSFVTKQLNAVNQQRVAAASVSMYESPRVHSELIKSFV